MSTWHLPASYLLSGGWQYEREEQVERRKHVVKYVMRNNDCTSHLLKYLWQMEYVVHDTTDDDSHDDHPEHTDGRNALQKAEHGINSSQTDALSAIWLYSC